MNAFLGNWMFILNYYKQDRIVVVGLVVGPLVASSKVVNESIRITQYGHEPGAEIADHLTVASWMDGANGQLKLITSEECMDKEKKLKITSNKQSAARTGVEQAADVGPNFKLLILRQC